MSFNATPDNDSHTSYPPMKESSSSDPSLRTSKPTNHFPTIDCRPMTPPSVTDDFGYSPRGIDIEKSPFLISDTVTLPEIPTKFSDCANRGPVLLSKSHNCFQMENIPKLVIKVQSEADFRKDGSSKSRLLSPTSTLLRTMEWRPSSPSDRIHDNDCNLESLNLGKMIISRRIKHQDSKLCSPVRSKAKGAMIALRLES